MKVIVAGGRDFADREQMGQILDHYFCASGDLYRRRVEGLKLVSGAARGADSLAIAWASFAEIPVRTFPADWDTYGKSAGYRRNEQMAKYADALIAFWDGKSRGTKHMIDLALEHGLEVHVYRY